MGIGRGLGLGLALLAALALPGCLSPIALDKAALAYNQATADVLTKQLLLNIARSRHNDPIHFSGISNIAATFNFQANAGATPALTGESGSTILPLFGIAATENPTISIVPMEGEEFTRRVLTPIQEHKMTLLLRQNIDVDLLLRLVGQEYRTRENGHEVAYHNRPKYGENYELFRKVALHLSSIQDRAAMYAEPLSFEQSWTIPAHGISGKGFKELEQGYSVRYDPIKQVYHLSRKVIGRVIITNYDPAQLSNEERAKLNDEIEKDSNNDLEIDIRPGFPGGEYPLRGKIRLRSLANIFNFIGKTLSTEAELEVAPDHRTPNVDDNPRFALKILESDPPFWANEIGVEYKGKFYTVAPDEGYPWNKTAFRLLAQIYQMTMSEVPKVGVPSITIAK